MSSQTRNERGDASSLDLRTLAIASLASAVAAIVVSRFWTSGTPFAAAITPVLVTLFKEALDRPTAKIAEKVTVSARALPQTEIREPAASHVGRDAQRDEGPTRRLEPTEPAPAGAADGDASDIRVYRQQAPATTGGRGRINPKVALITGLVAFAIAGVVLTAGQLAIGNPFGDDGNGAIILGGGKNSKQNAQTEPQNTTTEPQQTAPEQTTPQATPDQQQTAPVTPEDEESTGGQTAPQQAPRQLQQHTTPTTPTPTPTPTRP